MRIRVLPLLVVLVGSLSAPAVSVAAPFLLQFSGNWQFYDPQFDQPEFHSAMNGSGVFEGSPVTLWLLINDGDTNPDPGVGTYSIRGSIDVGSTHLALSPEHLSFYPGSGELNGWGQLSGPRADGFQPFFWQFQSGPSNPLPGVTDDFSSLIQFFQSARSYNAFYIGYRDGPNNCGLCLGTFNPVLTKVEAQPVPELGPLPLMLTGFFALAARRRKRSLRH